MTNRRIIIREYAFYNNGNRLVSFVQDGSGKCIINGLIDWLEKDYSGLSPTKRKNGVNGITANSLNKALRKEAKSHLKSINYETTVEKGAFYHDGNKGFDFSIIDEKYNVFKARDSFIGNPGILKGDKEMESFIFTSDGKSKLYGIKNKTAWKNWKTDNPFAIDETNYGINLCDDMQKRTLSTVGELQFGNWALARHDLFRVLTASESVPIDFYVYITSTGSLTQELSSGTVNFKKASEFIKSHVEVIKLPILVIGLDIAGKDEDYPSEKANNLIKLLNDNKELIMRGFNQ